MVVVEEPGVGAKSGQLAALQEQLSQSRTASPECSVPPTSHWVSPPA